MFLSSPNLDQLQAATSDHKDVDEIRWPILDGWAAQLTKRLKEKRGLQRRIAEQLGVDETVINNIKTQKQDTSPLVLQISDLAGIPRPFAILENSATARVFAMLNEAEDLSPKVLAFLRALAEEE